MGAEQNSAVGADANWYLVHLDSSGFPVAPQPHLWTKFTRSDLEPLYRIYITEHYCYDFSYFALFTYVFSLFLEVSHGAATLTHFSLTHIAATLWTHCTSIVLTHSIAILIVLPHWCSIYSGQSCRLFFS